jgi:hypothetical protein
MTLFAWPRKRTATSAPQHRLTAARFRPQLESLEDRKVLSTLHTVPSTLTVISAADSGPGTLRAEIAAANAGDIINFAPSLNGQTITLSSGELLINKSLTIAGPGASQLAISGGLTWRGFGGPSPVETTTSSRVFEVTGAGTNVTLSGLTITDGCAFGGIYSGPGPYGGAIANHDGSTLTVSGCTVSNSYAAEGGGIYNNTATLKLVNSTLSGNEAVADNGDGASGEGGGLYSNTGSTVSMTNCILSGNFANGSGGGIWTYSTVMTIIGCTFTGNVVAGQYGYYGEDIYNGEIDSVVNVKHGPDIELTICDSVFINNTPYQFLPIDGVWIDEGGNTFG